MVSGLWSVTTVYNKIKLVYFMAGFNCSLFAYGQTGAGKSYSMVGYGNNK